MEKILNLSQGNVTAEDAAYSFFPSYISVQHPGYNFAAHHKLIAKELMMVESGETTRLMIFAPPRHGKTYEISEFFPAWYLGRNPSDQIIAATYNYERAGDVGRAVRNQLVDPLYSEVFPGCSLAQTSKSVNRLKTDQGGTYFSVGINGALTGRGADLLLVDDPVKGKEDVQSSISKRKLENWFNTVAYTRLMPGGKVIIVITRWSYDDLAGYLLEEQAHENWRVIDLPAIAEMDGDILGRNTGEALWPDRYPVPVLNKIRTTLGTRDWNSLYQQRPIAEEGGMFSINDVQRYSQNELQAFKAALRMGADFDELTGPGRLYEKFKFKSIACSWDTAFKESELNDPSACTIWGETNSGYYLLRCFNKQLGYPALKKKVIEIYDSNRLLYGFSNARHPVIIEDRASGQSLIQDLKANTTIPVLAMKTPGSKHVRFDDCTKYFEAGNVYFPDKARWLVTVETQLSRFPYDKHDDIVDSISQYLNWIGRPRYVRGLNPSNWK